MVALIDEDDIANAAVAATAAVVAAATLLGLWRACTRPRLAPVLLLFGPLAPVLLLFGLFAPVFLLFGLLAPAFLLTGLFARLRVGDMGSTAPLAKSKQASEHTTSPLPALASRQLDKD